MQLNQWQADSLTMPAAEPMAGRVSSDLPGPFLTGRQWTQSPPRVPTIAAKVLKQARLPSQAFLKVTRPLKLLSFSTDAKEQRFLWLLSQAFVLLSDVVASSLLQKLAEVKAVRQGRGAGTKQPLLRL